MGKVQHVACPRCGQQVAWEPKSAYRPFCSERCKLLDLGAWATEQYRVPVQEDQNEPDVDEKPDR